MDLIERRVAIEALDRRFETFKETGDKWEWLKYRGDLYQLPQVQPKKLDTLIKALEAEHKKLREMQEAQSGPHWIPVTVINQNYIPELKDFPYGGVLFTYRTPKGKLLVREAWVERGRIIGKKMNGTPIAYQQKPEPWEGEAE